MDFPFANERVCVFLGNSHFVFNDLVDGIELNKQEAREELKFNFWCL